MRYLLILLFPLLLTAQEISVVRIENASRETISQLHKEGFDITASRVDQFCDMAVTSEDSLLLSKRFTLATLATGEELAQRRAALSESVKASRSVRAGTAPRYIDYDTYVRELEDLQSRYPQIMKIIDLGKSQGAIDGTPGFNHKIWGIKLSDNVEINEPEPGFLFCGEHHARETQTFPVTFHVLKHLLENYDTNPEVKSYVDSRQIFFVPLVNPDGYTVATTENSMWRKNINSNGYAVNFRSGSTTGVDLNRNYRYKWGENAPNVVTKDTYRGPYAQSEPEVQAIINLADKEALAASITFHSYSEVILIPFNQESNLEAPVDDPEVRKLANKMAKVMVKKSGYGTYEVGDAVELLGYGAGGGMSDNMYVDYGIFTYCFELWNGGFQTPESELPNLANNCLKASKILLDRSDYSSIQGVVTADGAPIKAKIEISGLDENPGDRCDYFSHIETGFFCRFPAPGNYTVTVTPESNQYEAQAFEVTVGNDSITRLDVAFGSVSKTVKLSVVNGSGSGEYNAGETIEIRADIAEGSLFTGWENLPESGVLDSLSNPVTITVPDTNITITALSQKLSSGSDYVQKGEWFKECDDGSVVALDSSKLESDSTITVTFNRAAASDAKPSWAGSGVAPTGKYDNISFVRLLYNSGDSCRISLIQKVLGDNGANYGVTLPATEAPTEVILPITGDFWRQDEWVKTVDSLQKPLTASELEGVIFEAFVGNSSITLRELNLIGFDESVSITPSALANNSEIRLLSTTRGSLSFVAPRSGNYRVRLFTSTGRVIADEAITASVDGSAISVPLSSAMGRQLLFCEITGTSGKLFTKIGL